MDVRSSEEKLVDSIAEHLQDELLSLDAEDLQVVKVEMVDGQLYVVLSNHSSWVVSVEKA